MLVNELPVKMRFRRTESLPSVHFTRPSGFTDFVRDETHFSTFVETTSCTSNSATLRDQSELVDTVLALNE